MGDEPTSDTEFDAAEAETADQVDELLDELEALEQHVDDHEARSRVRESIRLARRIDGDEGVFGQIIKGFDRHDAAEALVGSVVFGIPMVIEGGTLEAGAFVARHPVYFVGTLAFGISLVYGLLYVAEVQDVRVVDPLFGIIPRRFAGVLFIAAVTATAMMTAWGRVDWAMPWIAASQTAVCFVGMALGAALGDILPGT
ncbi:MAG: DUF2391 domain-containing protein [Halolamina sp.]